MAPMQMPVVRRRRVKVTEPEIKLPPRGSRGPVHISAVSYTHLGKRFDFEHLNMRSVDDDKVTDHHALIITGVEPEELNAHEQIVYTMIAGDVYKRQSAHLH